MSIPSLFCTRPLDGDSLSVEDPMADEGFNVTNEPMSGKVSWFEDD